ncbi:muscle m-line assembly protein unc-89, partial [Lasius niger]
MLGIPHRATDNKFISNIEGYKGNIHKLGRLLTHEWYTVIDKEGKSKERYLFLFKARILVCKVRRISEDRSVFVLKDIIRLPEVEVKDHPGDIRSFELHNPAIPNYPITLIAHKDPVKACWLKEIRQYASDLIALAEHAADDLQVTEEVPEAKEELKSDEKPLPVKFEPQQANPESFKVQAKEEAKANPSPPKVDSIKDTKVVEKPVKVEQQQANPGSLKVQAKEEAKANPSPPKVDSIKDSKVAEKPVKVEPQQANPGSLKVQAKEEAKANPSTPKVDSIKDSKVAEKPVKVEPQQANPGSLKVEAKEEAKANPGPPKVDSIKDSTKVVEKRKDSVTNISEAKKTKVEEAQADMSRRYSSSRYSASSKVVEEYSSISSSRNGVSAYAESAASAVETRMSSSSQGMGQISETTTSYETAITGGAATDSNVEKGTAKVTLGTDAGKPVFIKTIEGCSVE